MTEAGSARGIVLRISYPQLGRHSNRPRCGASSSNLACHLNELNEELINHAHISHSYATRQLAATNQSPSPGARSQSLSRTLSETTPSPVHSSHKPSINQSINCHRRFACDRKCCCQNTFSSFLAAALKYYMIWIPLKSPVVQHD